MTFELLAAAGEAAPQNSFGFVEAMEQGGIIAWSILAVLVIMSVGSFYILFTKLFEQRKVLAQYKAVRTQFWKTGSLRDGASKLEKNSAWRQLVDDAILAEDQHAKMTDKLAVVRSYQSRNAGHTYLKVTSGGNPMKAATSAVATRVGGAFDKKSGMPNNCLVLPEAIDENLKLGSNFETGALPGLSDPGTLGSTYSAFNPAGGGTVKENMELRITPDRLADRKGLLGGLDGIKRSLDADGSLEGADYFC